jgi:hypothetical protein
MYTMQRHFYTLVAMFNILSGTLPLQYLVFTSVACVLGPLICFRQGIYEALTFSLICHVETL